MLATNRSETDHDHSTGRTVRRSAAASYPMAGACSIFTATRWNGARIGWGLTAAKHLLATQWDHLQSLRCLKTTDCGVAWHVAGVLPRYDVHHLQQEPFSPPVPPPLLPRLPSGEDGLTLTRPPNMPTPSFRPLLALTQRPCSPQFPLWRQKVAFQVGPADLPRLQRQPVVDRPAVATSV